MKKEELEKIEKELQVMDERYLELYEKVLTEYPESLTGIVIMRGNPSDENNGIGLIGGSVHSLGIIVASLMDQSKELNDVIKEAVTNKLKAMIAK